MPPTEIAQFEEIAASLTSQVVAVAGGDREGDLLLYRQLREKAYVKQCILVGDEADMHREAERLGFSVSSEDIVATTSQEETAERILELAQSDRVDVIQKGNISTPILNRQLVRMRTRDTMSLATVFQAGCFRGGAPMIMTDAGVSAILNFSRMTGLIRNSVEIAQIALNIPKPKVALLAGNEKPMAALPSTLVARDLANAYWDDAIVYGPLSFDLAVDPASVRLKKETLPEGSPLYQVAGMADILVNPTLDAANIMYKMLMCMVQADLARMACVTVGIKAPYILSSRSDPEGSKIDSIALACIYADAMHKKAAGSSGSQNPEHKPPFRVLAIDPGFVRTKMAVFESCRRVKSFELAGANRPREKGEGLDAEVNRHVVQIRDLLGEDASRIDAVVGRDGFLDRENRHVEGVYRVCAVNEEGVFVDSNLAAILRNHTEIDHPSRLAVPIAARIGEELRVPVFAINSLIGDELHEESRHAGRPAVETWHSLSIRASAARAATAIGKPLDRSRFIVAHLGGGVCVAAVRDGKIVDIDLQNLAPEIEQAIHAGSEEAEKALRGVVYHTAKDIGAMSIAVGPALDALVLTGPLADSEPLVAGLKSRVGQLAQMLIYAENLELEAMAADVLAVLQGDKSLQSYQS